MVRRKVGWKDPFGKVVWVAFAVAFAASTGDALEEVVVAGDAPVVSSDTTEESGEEALVTVSTDVSPSSSSSSEKDPELQRLREERDKIAAENALAQEKLRKELFELEAEKKRLALENSLRSERIKAEMADMRSEIERTQIATESAAKLAALEVAKRRQVMEEELTVLRAEEERLKLENAIANQQIDARMAQMRLQEAEFKIQKAELEMQVTKLQAELSRREKSEILRDLAPEEQKYTTEPFADGVLVMSDRRIALNGLIIPYVADHVAERIDFFNNQSTEYPIFIVIDSSPGGSIMAGYKILKAMEGSQAPVYVVVKSFAASMAATITAMAERSFAYPNAVLLHHQMAWIGGGNLTQQREQLTEFEEWWKRIAAPVAEKMGFTLEEYIERMYEENSDGNWREFADVAQKYNWVDEIVNTIWDTSLDRNPDRFGTKPVIVVSMEEKFDEDGMPYAVLPRLQPLDAYFLYNPDGYYRLR